MTRRPLVDNRLKFDEPTHVYSVDGRELTSVTTWIKTFNPPFKPFNAQANATRMVSEGKAESEEELKASWKKAGDDGTDAHKEIEQYILGVKGIADVEGAKAGWGCVAYDKLLTRFDPITMFAELRVYSLSMGVAGTMDVLFLTPDGAVIIDWKTNKNIYKKKDSTVDVESYKLLAGDTYSTYLMQLNTYAYILQREHGIKVKALKLVHLKEDGYEIMDIPVMLQLVEEMTLQ